jgi:hypothetical protein
MNEYDEVKNILIKHDALDKEDEDLVDLDSPLYNELYSYFLNSGEMPYDVARARADVMPDEWIVDKLNELGLSFNEEAQHEINEDYAQRKSDGQIEE